MSDPYFDQTVLLMHMDGVNASTYFRDERNNLITVSGNAQISTAQSKFGGSSAYFDGTGDYLTIADTENLDFGAGDFTIEGWIRMNAVPSTAGNYSAFLCKDRTDVTPRGWLFLAANGDQSGAPTLSIRDGATSYALIGTAPLAVGVWTHLAVVRSGTNLMLFIDGVLEDTEAVGSAVFNDTTQAFRVGAAQNAAAGFFGYLNGYIDELRITKGVARYTAAFTPPATPFFHRIINDVYWNEVALLLHCDGANNSTTFTDEKGKTVTANGNAKISTAQSKFGGASAVFDGTGDYLSIADVAGLELSGGDFTIEAWVRYAAIGSSNTLIADGFNGTVGSWALWSDSGTLYFFASSNNSTWNIVTALKIIEGHTTGVWYHVAVTRKGDTWRTFCNGVMTSETTASGTIYNGTTALTIGASTAGSAAFNGYIDEVRITIGFARYTAAFTPQTEPFAAYSMQELSGVVLDPDGDPIQRRVAAFHRSTCRLVSETLSDPVTGAFSMPAVNNEDHFVVVFDDAKNALIYDRIEPVAE